MPRTEFLVTERVGKWFVDVGSETYGPYLSRHDAQLDAIDAAEDSQRRKRPAVVLVKVQGTAGEIVWPPSKAGVISA